MPRFLNTEWRIPEGKSGRVIGACAGGAYGLLVLIVGFWRALGFAFFVVLGAVVGAYIDMHGDVLENLARLIDSIDSRRRRNRREW